MTEREDSGRPADAGAAGACDAGPTPSRSLPDAGPRVSGGGPTILHVDDDPAVSALVETFVEREHADATVFSETDAERALERVGAGDVDCVVTDVDMPGMDGVALARALADGPRDVPVVLFTANRWRDVRGEGLAHLVADHVQKRGGHSQFESVASAVGAALD